MTHPRRRAHPSAFTLIELMVVVGIIGILASVAVPSFRNYTFRSRQAERTAILRTLKVTIDDYFNVQGGYPTDWGGGMSFLNLFTQNPDAMPGTSKRPWRRGIPDWSKLPFEVEGGLYYSYWGYAIAQQGSRFIVLIANGDLDGDQTQDELQKVYQYAGTPMVLQKFNWGPQMVCDDCSYAWRFPFPSITF